MSQSISSSRRIIVALATLACLVLHLHGAAEAKLLRRTRYYDDIDGGFGGSPYGGMGGMGGMGGVATGERAIMTVRGARNPYDGSAPSKLTIEDNPYRGPYPRGVYDRLDGGRPMYPRHDSYMNGGYGMNGPFGGGYGGQQQMYGAPARIAVTGAYPYGYGSRF